ncbi:MAG: hypothetical protein PUP91_39350 [Rhizonema sp. PD37]|nr:hypothetical protein [Rhizonema sp. PD37]
MRAISFTYVLLGMALAFARLWHRYECNGCHPGLFHSQYGAMVRLDRRS